MYLLLALLLLWGVWIDRARGGVNHADGLCRVQIAFDARVNPDWI